MLALVLSFSLLGHALTQNLTDTYGKTNAQIVAMGEDKWDAFYSAKAGTSTAAMVQMNGLYGDALTHRNDELIRHLSGARKAHALKLRKLLIKLGADCVDLGYNITGGGTIWSPVSAHIEIDVEQVLSGELGGKSKARTASAAKAKAALAQLDKAVAKSIKDNNINGNFDVAKAKASLKAIHADEKALSPLTSTVSSVNKGRVYGFSAWYLHLAIGDWS